MALEAAVYCAAGELRNAVAQAPHDVVEWQTGAASELNDDGLLGRRQDGAAGIARPHVSIGGGLPGAPLDDGLEVQLVLGGKGAGARLRRHAASFGRCHEEPTP